MHKLWSIIKMEFKLEFAYPITWVFFLVLPIVFTMVIGAALGGSAAMQQDEGRDLRPFLLIYDQDQSGLSTALTRTLLESQTIKAEIIFQSEEFSEELRNQLQGYLSIPKGFGDEIIAGQPTSLKLEVAGGDFSSVSIENSIRSAMQHTTASMSAAQGALLIYGDLNPQMTTEKQQQYLAKSMEQAQILLAESPIFKLEIIQPDPSNQSPNGLAGFNQSSAGQLVTWSLITLVGGSVIFARDREDGTYQRQFTTPTPKSVYFAGKILSRLLMGLIQMLILVFFGVYALKVNWGNDPILLILFLTVFSFTGTTLGLMLGAFAKTAKQADNITPLVSMLMAALGGAWWPLEITPPLYQTVVRALPSTWAMVGFNGIILKGYTFVDVLPEILVILTFGIAFSVIGIWRLGRQD
ncbi:MAG TPA: ABC transporter permease [Chloroflexi bacterium]|nr:ABC transporter permease [Chloroflexota bacterium]